MPRLDILSELGDNLIVSPTPLTFINPSLPSLVCVALASEVSSLRESIQPALGFCQRAIRCCEVFMVSAVETQHLVLFIEST